MLLRRIENFELLSLIFVLNLWSTGALQTHIRGWILFSFADQGVVLNGMEVWVLLDVCWEGPGVETSQYFAAWTFQKNKLAGWHHTMVSTSLVIAMCNMQHDDRWAWSPQEWQKRCRESSSLCCRTFSTASAPFQTELLDFCQGLLYSFSFHCATCDSAS